MESGQELKAAYLHEGAFIPGLGEVPKELVVGQGGHKSLNSLVLNNSLVTAVFTNTDKRVVYTILIPVSNFKSLLVSTKAITTPPLK